MSTRSQKACMGGLLASLSIVFQLAPVFFPVVGLFISPISTLPIALAAFQLGPYAFITYLSTATICFFFSPQEAIIFLLTTGSLGLALGFTLKNNLLLSFLSSGLTLFLGLLFLVFLFDVPVFGESIHLPMIITAILYYAFSVIYSFCWCLIMRKITKEINTNAK